MAKFFPKRKSPHGGAAGKTGATLLKVMTEAQQLLDAGRVDEARQLLESQMARFANHAPLRAALATVYGLSGRMQEAAVQARMALDLDPRHPDYLLLAALSYLGAGYRSFAQRVRQRWLATRPTGPLVDEMVQLEDEHRAEIELMYALSGAQNSQRAEEAGYRLDEGRWALAQNRFAEALSHFQAATRLAPRWPPPRNNASLALFFLGRYTAAIAECETILREYDPDNVHALANLVRLHVLGGESEKAQHYGDALADLPLPEDPEAALKQAEGLTFLERDTEIDRILGQIERRHTTLPARAALYRGIALANLGHPRAALKRLRGARDAGENSPLLTDTLAALEQGRRGTSIANRFSYTHYSELLPREAIDAVVKLLSREDRREERDARRWSELLQRYPQLPVVCRKMLYEMPTAVSPMIHVLGALRTPAAIATLQEFIRGPLGSDEERMEALRVLQETGGATAGAPVEIWLRGELTTVESYLQEISDEFVPDYPQQAWDIYSEAVLTQRAGDLDKAERLYWEMLKVAPNAKEAYNNLAVIYSLRGDNDRVNEFMDKALAIDPLYPFPLTGRALQALARGDAEAAKDLLKPLVKVRQWHPLGAAVYHKTLARIALYERDYDTAQQHVDFARRFSEEDPELPALEGQISLRRLSKIPANWFKDYDERSRQRRLRKPLPADPTLADCLALLSKGDMVGICRVVDSDARVSGRRVAEVRQYLQERLTAPGFVAGIVAELNDRERAALRDLLGHGGVMPRAAFITAYGEEDEWPYLEYHAATMTSVSGRLRARGLLFGGTSAGQVVVAIPRELRLLLAPTLA